MVLVVDGDTAQFPAAGAGHLVLSPVNEITERKSPESFSLGACCLRSGLSKNSLRPQGEAAGDTAEVIAGHQGHLIALAQESGDQW